MTRHSRHYPNDKTLHPEYVFAEKISLNAKKAQKNLIFLWTGSIINVILPIGQSLTKIFYQSATT